MGLSTTIATLIMLYAILVAAVVLAGILIKGLQLVNKFLLTISQNKYENVKIINATVLNNNGIIDLQFNLTNTGNTLIYDFSHCDLIIRYTSSGSAVTAVEKFYETETNNLGYWYIADIEISGNYIIPYAYPRGLAPSETAIIYANLPSPPDVNTTVKIIFVTPAGGKSYYEFFYRG